MTQARDVAAPPISPMRGWGSACAIFTAAVVVALVGTMLAAWLMGGGRMFQGGLAAWGLCWGAAFLALLVVFGGRFLGQSVPAILLAMGIRMGLPLLLAFYLTNQSPFWGEARLIMFLLGNYFVALIAETGLAIQLLQGVSPLAPAKVGTVKTPDGSGASNLAGGKLAS